MINGSWATTACLAIVLLSYFSSPAEAARIRVSQESRPGAGDFDRHTLGHIDAYASRETTAAQYYGYAQFAYASYNGPSPVCGPTPPTCSSCARRRA